MSENEPVDSIIGFLVDGVETYEVRKRLVGRRATCIRDERFAVLAIRSGSSSIRLLQQYRLSMVHNNRQLYLASFSTFA